MLFGGLQKTTLSDFPGHIAALVFTQGCTFRCPYCHNPELVKKGESSFTTEEVLSFLQKRQGKLTGLVVSGGEPTLHCELPQFLRSVKELGYDIKLDTNGSRPGVIKELLADKLIDYVAMDVKAPLGKYEQLAGRQVDTSSIAKTIALLVQSQVAHEFRTTVVSPFLTEDDLVEIGTLVQGANKYVLQPYRKLKTLNENWSLGARQMEQVIMERVSSKLKACGLSCSIR